MSPSGDRGPNSSHDGLFPFSHLTDGIWDQYEVVKRLGKGNFGLVVLLREKTTGRYVAAKAIEITDDNISSYEREFKYYRDLKHPNIVQIEYSVSVPIRTQHLNCEYRIVIMEYCEEGSVRQAMEKNLLSFDDGSVWKTMTGALRGLAAIHSKNLMHRDIKPENLLYAKKWETKICDFGTMRECNTLKPTEGTGTANYIAPEGNDHYDKKCDIFSLGIVFFEIVLVCSGVKVGHLMTTLTNRFYNDKKRKFPKEFGKGLNPKAVKAAEKLIKRMLCKNPKKRPSALQILQDATLLEATGMRAYKTDLLTKSRRMVMISTMLEQYFFNWKSILDLELPLTDKERLEIVEMCAPCRKASDALPNNYNTSAQTAALLIIELLLTSSNPEIIFRLLHNKWKFEHSLAKELPLSNTSPNPRQFVTRCESLFKEKRNIHHFLSMHYFIRHLEQGARNAALSELYKSLNNGPARIATFWYHVSLENVLEQWEKSEILKRCRLLRNLIPESKFKDVPKVRIRNFSRLCIRVICKVLKQGHLTSLERSAIEQLKKEHDGEIEANTSLFTRFAEIFGTINNLTISKYSLE